MLRIHITWDFISPTLQTVSGIVEVHHVLNTEWNKVAKFRTTVKPGSIGYQSLDSKGVSTVVLEAVKPQLDIMVRSYQQGVIMDKTDFSWIVEEDIEKGLAEMRKLPLQTIDDKTFEVKHGEGVGW